MSSLSDGDSAVGMGSTCPSPDVGERDLSCPTQTPEQGTVGGGFIPPNCTVSINQTFIAECHSNRLSVEQVKGAANFIMPETDHSQDGPENTPAIPPQQTMLPGNCGETLALLPAETQRDNFRPGQGEENPNSHNDQPQLPNPDQDQTDASACHLPFPMQAEEEGETSDVLEFIESKI
ncbi:hypothetical protein BaRGS_00008937 [Batillaria attramentaria]|uniref:Uncharacterized protein n=1 Tax=Batillaria attramentaria TaxID=370345 RepID=A0ABD0LKU3_9CAEN